MIRGNEIRKKLAGGCVHEDLNSSAETGDISQNPLGDQFFHSYNELFKIVRWNDILSLVIFPYTSDLVSAWKNATWT
jgi:hypothetical protein